MKKRKLINMILPSRGWKIFAVITAGVIFGLGIFTVYASRAWSYMSDEPATCVNCHVMGPYYDTWQHSSHSIHANCNDCHVPHDNIFREYYFHAKDGLRHATIFTLGLEPQVMQAIPASQKVIMENCIRCHTQLNTEFVKTGTHNFKDMLSKGDFACWDCHRDVPHGGKNSLSTTPNALVPYPVSEVPVWLKKMMKEKKSS